MAILALVLATLTVGPSWMVRADVHLDQQARAIAKVLKCPVCQNLSVADSPSQLAGQMRDLIRSRLEAGQSRDEILAYFVDRYGEEVLLDPPKTGLGQLVWWGSGAILTGASALVALLLHRWLGGRRRDPEPDLELSDEELKEYEAILEAELQRPGRGGVW